jgi:hypothetical protein
MIEHDELYFIQRSALRDSSGGASLRAVTLDARGTSAYLAFRTRELAQAFIDAEQARGMEAVSATAPGLAQPGDFDGALLLLVGSAAEVAQFAAAPGAFGHAGRLYRCRFGDGKLRWHLPDARPANTARGGRGGEEGTAAQAGGAKPAPARPTAAGPTTARPAPAGPGWGLLPERGDGEAFSLRQVLLHFFVDFNPLYFISAVCVLYGIFLIDRNIEQLGLPTIEAQQFVLFGVIQLYEILVIAGSAFLAHRARASRPAVMLGLLECVLLFDCTFRIESASVQGAFGHLLLVVWLLLTVAKVWGLARALRLPLPRPQFAALTATAAGMAGCIYWLSMAGSDKALALQVAAWFGAFVLLMLEARRPELLSALARDEGQRDTAALCVRAGYRLLAGFYFYHFGAYAVLSGAPQIGEIAVPALASTFLLLFALIREGEKQAWAFGLLVIGAALFNFVALAWAMELVALLWIYRVWRGAHSNLALGAVVAFYGAALLAAWFSGDTEMLRLPGPLAWQNLALAAALAYIGLYLRNHLAWYLLAALGGYCAYTRVAWKQLVPSDELSRGLLFLSTGFAALIGGVLVNWLFRARVEQPAQPLPGA